MSTRALSLHEPWKQRGEVRVQLNSVPTINVAASAAKDQLVEKTSSGLLVNKRMFSSNRRSRRERSPAAIKWTNKPPCVYIHIYTCLYICVCVCVFAATISYKMSEAKATVYFLSVNHTLVLNNLAPPFLCVCGCVCLFVCV